MAARLQAAAQWLTAAPSLCGLPEQEGGNTHKQTLTWLGAPSPRRPPSLILDIAPAFTTYVVRSPHSIGDVRNNLASFLTLFCRYLPRPVIRQSVGREDGQQGHGAQQKEGNS